MQSEDALFADDDELKCNMREELWCVRKEFNVTGIQYLAQSWKKGIDNGGKFVKKNNLNFVKDVLVMYVNFTIIVITPSEKKKIGGITFVPPFVLNLFSFTNSTAKSRYAMSHLHACHLCKIFHLVCYGNY